MNRLFKLPLLIALTLGSTQLLAVDFGQVRVLSNLGQPLLAEIPLRGTTPAEVQNLTATLASAGEYERAGIVGGRTTVPLSFSIVAGSGGQHFIRIASTAPVDDPYLDLLLDVSTPAGKSVHEFAILLDPPGMSEAPIAGRQPAAGTPANAGAVAQPAAPAAAAASKPAPVKAAQAAPATAGKPSGAVVKGMYGPVERGQTLTGIAQQTMPAGVDLNQMLLAIKQANPDAFYRDNINTLKSGVVLRVPSAADAQAMTVAAAVAEVRRQNGEWRTGDVGAPTAVANAAMRSPASNAAPAAAANTGDRLALLAAKDSANAGGGAAASAQGAGAESAAELRKSLLRAQESLASERQQVADLQTHLKELDDVNRKSERLLSLKDNEIAELQARLAAARKAGSASPASAAASTTSLAAAQSAARALAASVAAAPAPAASASAPALAAAGSAGMAAAASGATTGANASPTSATDIEPTPATAAQPPTAVQPWYIQTWAWIAGGGIVVLLILAGLLGRQRKHPAPTKTKTAPSLAESFAAPRGEGGVSADDVDHGELLDQLAEHPDDIGLHLQLVTLYYSRRDVEHFEAAAEAMYAHITDPQQDEWQDVVHMGEDLVPEHPLFSHQVQLPALAANTPLEDFNIDDYADDAAPTLTAPDIPVDADAPAVHPDVDMAPLELDAAVSAGLHAVSDQLDVSPDQPAAIGAAAGIEMPEWAPDATSAPGSEGLDERLGEFNDDPIDTKLDLARAYLDMGDDEGARAMLDEVLKEGSQMQKDVAAALLGDLQH